MPVGGQVPVEVEVVGRSGCKGSWWANGGPGKVSGEGSPRDRPIALTQPRHNPLTTQTLSTYL